MLVISIELMFIFCALALYSWLLYKSNQKLYSIAQHMESIQRLTIDQMEAARIRTHCFVVRFNDLGEVIDYVKFPTKEKALIYIDDIKTAGDFYDLIEGAVTDFLET